MSLATRLETLVKKPVEALHNHERVQKGLHTVDAWLDRHVPATVVAPLRREVSLDSLGEAASAARTEFKAWLKNDEVPAAEAEVVEEHVEEAPVVEVAAEDVTADAAPEA